MDAKTTRHREREILKSKKINKAIRTLVNRDQTVISSIKRLLNEIVRYLFFYLFICLKKMKTKQKMD
jgi:hypothetical protein